MKSFIRGALAIALLGSVSTAAFAGDLPSRNDAPVPAYTAPAPVYSWTGFYVGAEFGGQFGKDTGYIVNNYTANAPASTGNYKTSGVVGGGLAGYNYQINQFVLGVEGDLEGSSNQGRFTGPMGLGSVNTQYGLGGGVRGRLGFALDRTLFYATGGWAAEDITHTYDLGNGASEKHSTGRSGYTLGGGVEYAFAPNWSARLEYRWTDYGKYVSTSNDIFSRQQNPSDNTIRAAVMYHFAIPAPVLAKF